MASALAQLFENKKSKVLNIYCTAGFPELDSTTQVIAALQQAGADLIEIGMPYSDPLADGWIIQQSSFQALQNGMTMDILFEQLAKFFPQTKVPLVLMGYMNPVLQYGFEAFCKKAAETGISGLILPDMPPQAFEKTYQAITKQYGLDFIFLITPETKPDRICWLDSLSSGFLYAVSSSSTTGTAVNAENMEAYLVRLQAMELKNPILVGFGIKDKNSFDKACQYAQGAIIGSAYIQTLTKNPTNVPEATKRFIQSVIAS